MRLEVVTPGGIVVDTDVDKVTAESPVGSFTMLPRHIDLAAPLVAGLLEYERDGIEHVIAVDEGIVVKRGPHVQVAVHQAFTGDDVLGLQRALRSSLADLVESERRSRTALAHLETDAVRRLIELEDHG